MAINLTVNGKPFEVDLRCLPADVTLNTFIRDHVGLKGTKFMCLEGGCGVCVCVVRRGQDRTWAMNSCLTLLNVCDGWEVTTIEGLGSRLDGYHPLQKQLARFNGSQCGYCSPAMIMNMYGLLRSKAGGAITAWEVENSFGGHICRCTGYRPIMDAMKAFAADGECGDIEDLASPCAKRCEGVCRNPPITLHGGVKWFWPTTLAEVFGIIKSLGEEKYMLVAGNTAHGVYRRPVDLRAFVDVNKVGELHGYNVDQECLVLGANLSLSEAMEVFKDAGTKGGFEYCQELHNHFDLIAHVAVRNMGTLAGNLMTKHDHPEFPSDVFITFEALGALVIVGNDDGVETMSLAQFRVTDMRGKVLIAIKLRAYNPDEFIFKSFKVMPRAQNAHAYVNAAFLLQLSPSRMNIYSARVCFGGINPNFVHSAAVEKLLVGMRFPPPDDVLKTVFRRLLQELEPDSVLPDASVEYRRMLACGLFYKFLLSIAPKSLVSPTLRTGGEMLKRPLSSGHQKFETNVETFPITQPVQKLEAMPQCSGEARYTNDLPCQPKEIYCAYVNATKVGVGIEAIDASAALAIPGVLAFYSAKDIPGLNSSVSNKFFTINHNDEEIFCAGKVKYFGQPVGVVIAESSALANTAASKVIVTYSRGNPRVFVDMMDILKANEVDRIQDILISPILKLQLISAAELSARGSLHLGQQYHFTMEPHTTVVVPSEGRLEVFATTQWMDLTQYAIAASLRMKVSDVQVNVRRLGGGFGTKITRTNQSACAASLAAMKLNQPVRFVQSIESMMDLLGKRWAFYDEYEFHVTRRGRIVGLESWFYEDAGFSSNENAIEGLLPAAAQNCYHFEDNFKLDGKICFTDTPSHTWCRAPATAEGFAMIETIMEHIAFETGLDPVEVRLENMAPDHVMRGLTTRFVESTCYRERRAEIDAFNKEHRWRKRGLGISLMQFHVMYFGPFPATVAIYHGDGTVVVSFGGIEMGQGINTKAAQVVAHVLAIPLELVTVESSNTLNGANVMFTGGSVSTESVCLAVRKACDTLLDRLLAYRAPGSDWTSVVEQAYVGGANLIASDYCSRLDMDPYYVYGLSLTEVEVDVLTGNLLVRRVDILEDTGESLNPALDVGQIEGAFVMGLGYYLTEQLVYDKKSGALLTNRTWNYKPPGCKDIPIDFRIELIQKSPNPAGFMRSKATGEPAICLAVSVLFAIRHALESARKDAGLERKWISLGAPTTPEQILLNSGVDITQFKLQ